MENLQNRMTKHIGFDSVIEPLPIPVTALFHIRTICRFKNMTPIVMMGGMVAEHGVPLEKLDEYSQQIGEIMSELMILQAVLLDIKIKGKSDIIFLWKHPEIIKRKEAVDALVNAVVPLNFDNLPESSQGRIQEAVSYGQRKNIANMPQKEMEQD